MELCLLALLLNWNIVDQLVVIRIIFFCSQEDLKNLKFIGEWYREQRATKNAYEWVDRFTFRRTSLDD